MEVHIKDYGALGTITPTLLRQYLTSHGWSKEETWRNRIVVWSMARDEQRNQILMPLNELSDTYPLRMSEAVSILAEVENRSQLNVYHEVLAGGADVIRLRVLNDNGTDRRSLSDSAKLLSDARELLTSAARAAERPGQPVYRGRLSGEVTQYIDGVRPLPGYETDETLILHSRVPPDYGEQIDMGDLFHQPFGRRAALALEHGLREVGNTVQEVLGGGEGISLFEQAAQRGVSANMCDAVASLASRQDGIEIGLSWAQVRPAIKSDTRFGFAQSHADVLSDGANLLRRKNPFLDANITGEIVRLDRDSHEEFDGQAVVLCELDRRPAALHVQFATQDKEEVVRAFRNSIEISLDGDIHREGNRHVLKNPRNFLLLN